MKTSQLLFIVLFVLTTVSACKKFEEDDKIQFQSPNKRLTVSTWKITKFTVSGIDSTALKDSVFKDLPFRFFDDKDMAAKNLMLDYVRLGDWELTDDKDLKLTIWEDQAAIIAAHPVDSVIVNQLRLLGGLYHIIKLSDNELKISRADNQDAQIEFKGTKI